MRCLDKSGNNSNSIDNVRSNVVEMKYFANNHTLKCRI